MADRDNWETAQKLRAKAADEATPAPERAALIERAAALEEKSDGPSTAPRGVGKFGVVVDSAAADAFIASWLDLEGIIEYGYQTNEGRGDDW